VDAPPPSREQLRRVRRRERWLLVTAVLALAVTVGAVAYARNQATDPEPLATTAATRSAAPPAACADALALADLLAGHVGPLADAANGHVNVMELLELTLEGKPGGIDGKEAYRRSGPQMAVMADHGPDAEVQTRRYQRIRKRCPLR
jgi:hypothetical protein